MFRPYGIIADPELWHTLSNYSVLGMSHAAPSRRIVTAAPESRCPDAVSDYRDAESGAGQPQTEAAARTSAA